MHWIYLSLAAVFEIAWALGLKYSDGFTKLWPTTFTLVGMVLSTFFLAVAVQKIPLGTGYAIWTSIGAVGTALLGIVLFSESAAPARLFFIAVIVFGVIGLNITSYR
jgi:quaternary ammonium compound-resistance protein SugE